MGKRAAWRILGLTATGLGFIGIFLPLVPTTPFLLLAAFAFARSSPELLAWLTGHPTFGAMIRNWQRHGAIDRRSKVLAILVMAATVALSAAVGVDLWVMAVHGAVLAAVAVFVVTRPEGPRSSGR